MAIIFLASCNTEEPSLKATIEGDWTLVSIEFIDEQYTVNPQNISIHFLGGCEANMCQGEITTEGEKTDFTTTLFQEVRIK